MKRTLSLLLAAVLSLSVCASCSKPAGEEDGLDEIELSRSAAPAAGMPFTDVATGDWFYDDVATAYASGLINGKSASSFAPQDCLTYAEAVKLAACMHQLHTDGEVSLTASSGGAWYQSYVDYCYDNGILDGPYVWQAEATRAEYMRIFAHSLPAAALAAVNDVPDGAIPDLGARDPRTTDAVYLLYRAGVVQGTGADHRCEPDSFVTRAEVAAILTRMMFPETRKIFSMELPEHRIETIGGVTYVDGILVANKTYSLPRDYAPGGLTAECQAALDAMCAAAYEDGISLWPISTYRSYDYQEGLYNRYVERDGKEEADRYSARPGHSEHQTGLAVDLNSLEYAFADTPEGRWIAAHCHEYGFILRYPQDKEDVTGYRYEPWHVRYLGTDAAGKVAASGLCLEEYLGITSEYGD
jgi:D-alanyl-D-alanine carboxypeptidase